MKKVIGIIVFLVAVVLLGLPFYAGIKAESELHRIAQRLDAYPGYEVQWLDYDRHWFSTQATVSVGMDFPKGANTHQKQDFPKLPLVLNIQHGPLLLNDAAALGWYAWELELTEDQMAWLEEHLDRQEKGQLFESRGHVGLGGTVAFNSALQAFSVADDQGNTFLQVKGYEGSGAVSSTGQLHYAGVFKGMELSSQDALLVMGETTLAGSGDLSRLDWDTFMYPSQFSMNLSSLHMQGGGEAYAATNAVIKAAVKMPVEEDWFSLTMSMRADRISGPEMQVDDAAITLGYERVSLAFYQAYMNMAEAMMESAEQDLNFQKFFTPEIIREFIANGPAFAIRNISFTMPAGSFKGEFELAIQKDFVMPANLNPLMLIQALAVRLHAQIDRPLAVYFAKKAAREQAQVAATQKPKAPSTDIDPAAVKQQAQQRIESLIAQGILVPKNGKLTVTVKFANGQFVLNGKPMPLPLGALMGGGQSQPGQQSQPATRP